jgi:ketosteroid isomerase-like protein
MKKYTPFIFLLFLSACRFKTDVKKPEAAGVNEKMQMMEADRAFSKMSKEKGMHKAFIEYMDDDGVLLRPENYPLIGADAVDHLTQINDTNFVMQWEPRGGAIAKSGELGYTYGLYMLKPSHADTVLYGTYVSIWKKQPDGRWKFILDSGNEGVPAGTDSL